jgi:hypothetical protein
MRWSTRESEWLLRLILRFCWSVAIAEPLSVVMLAIFCSN